MGIGDTVITQTDNEDEFLHGQMALVGELPNETNHANGQFVIAQEPIPAGEIRLAKFHGVTPCKLSYSAGDIGAFPIWADVITGDVTQLQASQSAGEARLVAPRQIAGSETWFMVNLHDRKSASGGGGGDVREVVDWLHHFNNSTPADGDAANIAFLPAVYVDPPSAVYLDANADTNDYIDWSAEDWPDAVVTVDIRAETDSALASPGNDGISTFDAKLQYWTGAAWSAISTYAEFNAVHEVSSTHESSRATYSGAFQWKLSNTAQIYDNAGTDHYRIRVYFAIDDASGNIDWNAARGTIKVTTARSVTP